MKSKQGRGAWEKVGTGVEPDLDLEGRSCPATLDMPTLFVQHRVLAVGQTEGIFGLNIFSLGGGVAGRGGIRRVMSSSFDGSAPLMYATLVSGRPRDDLLAIIASIAALSASFFISGPFALPPPQATLENNGPFTPRGCSCGEMLL